MLNRALSHVSKLRRNFGDLKLVILGEGAERPSLESQIGRLGLRDHVLLPGYRVKAERYLAYFSVLALPSLTEGMPMTVLEALRASVPVVATKVGGVPEMLASGEAGVLVEPRSVTALVNGLGWLLRDSGVASSLAEKGARLVREKYSSTNMAREYLKVYCSVA